MICPCETSNAVKFTMPGGVVEVSNSWTVDTTDKVHLTFTVRDTGIGMSRQVLTRLFQPFTQADASTSRRFGGTGLGLSIVKKLLTAMGGNIRVDSQEGFGTTFTVTLSCPQSHIIPEPPAAPPSNTHMGILLAEDNPVTQTLVKRMLKDYSIDTADNGEMALNMVKASPYKYTVLLCDLNMPVMDGLEATREIRKLEHGKNIYIVGLTANAFKTDRGYNLHTKCWLNLIYFYRGCLPRGWNGRFPFQAIHEGGIIGYHWQGKSDKTVVGVTSGGQRVWGTTRWRAIPPTIGPCYFDAIPLNPIPVSPCLLHALSFDPMNGVTLPVFT